jgi:hypothetical protein
MTYPISQPADNAAAYTYTQPIRDSIAGVNDHQLRLTAIEVVTSSLRTGNYTLIAGDMGTEQVYNSTAAGTFTVPTDASASITPGRWVPLHQFGTGQLSVVGASGVTVNSRGGALKLAGQFAIAELRKIGVNAWVFYGDITT